MYDWHMDSIFERHIQSLPDPEDSVRRARYDMIEARGRAAKILNAARELTNWREMRQAKRDIIAHRERNVWPYEIQ